MMKPSANNAHPTNAYEQRKGSGLQSKPTNINKPHPQQFKRSLLMSYVSNYPSNHPSNHPKNTTGASNTTCTNTTQSSTTNLFQQLNGMEDDWLLLKKGYRKLSVIGDTLQGAMYEAIEIKSNNNKHVLIKRTQKDLFKKRICIQNGMNIVVEENAIKEALILRHLTLNKSISTYICRFTDFFESDNAYYLVMNYMNDTVTLKEFVEQCHIYLKSKRLQLKEYKKMVKYIFWQLAVAMYWLHVDMKCCHLNINMESILIGDSKFIMNSDQSVNINSGITVQIHNFGLAEIFKSSDKIKPHQINNNYHQNDDNKMDIYDTKTDYKIFHCAKDGITMKTIFCAPNVFNGVVYDAIKADHWSLGVVLFYMSTGMRAYHSHNYNDYGYRCIRTGHIDTFLRKCNLKQYVNSTLLSLINGLLVFDESKRYNSQEIIRCAWLKSYYARYKNKIEQANIQSNSKKMKLFPYYSLPGLT